MKRGNIIILRKRDGFNHIDDIFEAWGSLTELCKNHPDFSYSYMKSKKYPFYYKGWNFIKVPFRAVAE